MKAIITCLACWAIGALMFIMGITLQLNADALPQDGMLWVWNLGCTSMIAASLLTFFGIPAIVMHKLSKGN